tara:strand:+ start:3608 stop:4378 length:771 start_codon:yes stop_codon:yes gene_type:complete
MNIFKKIELQLLSFKQLKRHVPLLTLTILNIFCGLLGSKLMSAAMFTALRRISILMCMYAQQYYLKQQLSSIAICSVWCTVAGALFASSNDLNFDLTAYCIVFINNILTAGQQVLTQVSMAQKLEKTTLVLYNSICILFVGIIVIYVKENELKKIIFFDLWTHTEFIILMICSCFMGLAINYSVIWCIEQNGPLTLAISGSLKNIVVGLLSCARLFDTDYLFTWPNFLGLQFAAIASLVYVWSKTIEIKKQRQGVY